MWLIVYEPISETVGKVVLAVENPSDSQEVDTEYSFSVESFPTAEGKSGFTPIWMVRLPEQELYYEYEAIPFSIPEIQARLATIEETATLHENVTAEMFYYFVSVQDAGEYQTALILNGLSEVQEGSE